MDELNDDELLADAIACVALDALDRLADEPEARAGSCWNCSRCWGGTVWVYRRCSDDRAACTVARPKLQ